MKISGVYTAIVTPFKNNKKIDYLSFIKLLNMQIDAGVSGVVLFSTTGEGDSLSREEKLSLLVLAEKVISGRIQILVGLGSGVTREIINQIKLFSPFKIDAFLISSPAFVKPTQKGLVEHFKKIADFSPAPIILYNVPTRSGVNLEYEAVKVLSEHKNIVGIKEASGDLNYAYKISKLTNDNFVMLSGNDDLTLYLMMMGAVGTISVISNIFPQKLVEMIKKCTNFDYFCANNINLQLMPIIKNIFLQTNPIGIKCAMAEYGLIKNNLRLPLAKMQQKYRKLIKNCKIE